MDTDVSRNTPHVRTAPAADARCGRALHLAHEVIAAVLVVRPLLVCSCMCHSLSVCSLTPSSWTLESTCRAIIALLGAPDATSPLNCDAGNLLRAGDTLGFESLARMYTIEHASDTMPTITSKAGANV
jgi:hypothetical protein